MKDYTKGKIYIIIDNDNISLPYIGSTIQLLTKRLEKHKSRETCSCMDIINRNNFKMEVLEHYPCNNVEELRSREQYYIDKIDCCNKRKAIQTKEERREYEKRYRENNKQLIKKTCADWYVKNREHALKREKEYREKNKDKKKEYNKQLNQYKKSWGVWSDNNLLNIKTDLFI
jgi:predicted GIY-YIG superfamily endonuclease